MNRVVILLAAIFLAGCDHEPMRRIVLSESSTSTFTVEQVATFQDNLAYDGFRGIYLITDTETGKVYVGVSGIGIAERGTHSTGKTTLADER